MRFSSENLRFSRPIYSQVLNCRGMKGGEGDKFQCLENLLILQDVIKIHHFGLFLIFSSFFPHHVIGDPHDPFYGNRSKQYQISIKFKFSFAAFFSKWNLMSSCNEHQAC